MIFQNYEKEINTHTKVEQNMQDLINEYKGKVRGLENELESTKSRVLVGFFHQKLEGELKQVAEQNKSLETTNAQFKALFTNSSLTKRIKSKSKRNTRKSSSTDRYRTDILLDNNQSEFKSFNPKTKKAKLFHPFNNQSKDLLLTHPASDLMGESVDLNDQEKEG